MKAAVLHKVKGKVSLETVADPECPIDGVIIEVKACGVCRSDHHTWTGADKGLVLPHIMGHEFAGLVQEVGVNCTQYQVGDRVTGPFILGCGRCPDCSSAQPTICDHQRLIGFTQWGAFAERVSVQAADFNLVKLPDIVGYTEDASMGCRVTTAWRGLNDRAALQSGEWVAVHGCGGVGLSVIMLASAISAPIVAIDVSEDALKKAKELGAHACINAAKTDNVAEAVYEITGGGAHVSVDALGISTTFENSLRSLRKLGRHLQIGMPVGVNAIVPLPLLELVYSKQLSILGMRGLGAAEFVTLLDMVEAGTLDLGKLVTSRIQLSKVGDALSLMEMAQPSGITVIDNFTE